MRKKQTKIIATISDRRCDPAFLREMRDAGVDVVRLNTAHQTPKETLQVINNIRKVSDRIGILVDTKGPEVRTTQVEEDINFFKGDIVRMIGTSQGLVSDKESIYVNYADFHQDIPLHAKIFIDDGKMELRVQKKAKNYLECQVMNDGVVKSNKSVNVPDVHIDFETLNKKDREYIDFCIKHDVDFIAHSFVRNKEDILAIQKILDKKKSKIKIIAKIENHEGVKNIDEILDYAHGIMVARGDLGIEIAAEEIPLIQKEIIRKCIVRKKPVIVATQMLQSMVKNPRPTRAEVSDVANAVLDGADAVMLSEESAGGDYPIEAVSIMSKIARRIEAENDGFYSRHLPIIKNEKTPANYLIKAAVEAAKELDIKEIIIASGSGSAAEAIAAYRSNVPVYIKCFNKTTVRQLAMTYGVNAHYVEKEENHTKFITKLFKQLVKKEILSPKDKIVFLTGDTNNGVETNLMEICEVGRYV